MGVQGYPSCSKGCDCTWPPTPLREKEQDLVASLESGGSTFLAWVYSPANRPSDAESGSLSGAWSRRLFLTVLQASLPLGPYDPVDPMVLEVSVIDRDAVWSL